METYAHLWYYLVQCLPCWDRRHCTTGWHTPQQCCLSPRCTVYRKVRLWSNDNEIIAYAPLILQIALEFVLFLSQPHLNANAFHLMRYCTRNESIPTEVSQNRIHNTSREANRSFQLFVPHLYRKRKFEVLKISSVDILCHLMLMCTSKIERLRTSVV
jgi:hypothetical protein